VLSAVNNFSKSVSLKGSDSTADTYYTVSPRPLPENVVELIKEKSKLHACQAFLRENMTAKEDALLKAKNAVADISSVARPEKPTLVVPKKLASVTEDFGWAQLTAAEINKFLEAEAYASHIGKFIHEGGILTKLRTEFSSIPAVEWMTIKDGEKSPVRITTHHSAEQLYELHEQFAEIHRGYEQEVNYFKAKVKNLTTLENARIAKLNSDAQNDAAKLNNDLSSEYEKAEKRAWEEVRSIQAEFEKERQTDISCIAALRIQVDPRFQETVDLFLAKLPDAK
jgi:DNA gyrase/topoisomerase IV subunit A